MALRNEGPVPFSVRRTSGTAERWRASTALRSVGPVPLSVRCRAGTAERWRNRPAFRNVRRALTSGRRSTGTACPFRATPRRPGSRSTRGVRRVPLLESSGRQLPEAKGPRRSTARARARERTRASRFAAGSPGPPARARSGERVRRTSGTESFPSGWRFRTNASRRHSSGSGLVRIHRRAKARVRGEERRPPCGPGGSRWRRRRRATPLAARTRPRGP